MTQCVDQQEFLPKIRFREKPLGHPPKISHHTEQLDQRLKNNSNHGQVVGFRKCKRQRQYDKRVTGA